MRTAWLLTAFALGAGATSWTPRSLSQYLRVRRGRRDVVWHGTGTLRNTINGEVVAEVESVERARPLSDASGDGYVSEKLMLYRDVINGTLLTSFKKRPVRPLRYEHHVRVALADGGKLRLVAAEPGGREVASVVADGAGPKRVGLVGRAYELFLRVHVGQDKVVRGRKKKAAIGSREEYRLREAGPLGLNSRLSYRRTGRCPSWYGPGTCTLELYSRRQWSWAFWRREPPACWRRCHEEADAAAASD